MVFRRRVPRRSVLNTRGSCGLAGLALASCMAGPAAAAGADPAGGLGTIVVRAAPPSERILIDRKVYTLFGELQKTTGTAADILNQIPSVDVDADGNVSLRGDANVTILVDGKPSAQFSGATRGLSLQQFPAQDIERVEVMTNPPARYKAEGSAGVINIITRKTRRAGLSGNANLSLGDKRRVVAGLSANYNVGRLKLSGGITVRQDAKDRRVADSRTATDPASGAFVASRETIDEHFRRLIPLVKFGVDYDLNASQSMSYSFSHRELSGNRFFLQHDQTGAVAGPLSSLSDRHSNGHEWSVDNGQNLSFDQKLGRHGETLSLSFQRSATRERERYAYANDAIVPPGPPSFDHLRLSLDLVTTEASADLVLPFSRDRTLKLGYDFENDDNRFDNVGDTVDRVTGQPANNPNITNHFRFRQRINTAYGEYQAAVGHWTLQTGLRLEETGVSTLQVIDNVPGAYRYFRAYPSLNLDRQLSDRAKLSLSVSRRVNRPDPEALNPFTDYQDTRNLRAGNANLLPQDTWSYQLGYTSSIKALNYGLTGYYQFNRDSVTDVTKVVSADVVLATKANLPKSRSAGFEFTANGKLASKLSYSLSGNLFYTQINAAALGASGLQSTVGVNVKASLDCKPTPRDTAQISFSRTDKRLTPQGNVGAINLVNVGYKHQISPDLSMVITVSDAFDGQRFHRLIATPALRDEYNRHQVGRVAYLGLVYTFGAPKKVKPGAFEYDQ